MSTHAATRRRADAYRGAVQDRLPLPSDFGALPESAFDWRRSVVAPEPPPTPPSLASIDLLGGVPASRWRVRKQLGKPTCVAQAAVACLELMRARQSGAAVTLLSPRFLDERLRARRAGDPQPGCGPVPLGSRTAKLCEAANALAAEGICTEASWGEAAHDAGKVPGAVIFAEAAANAAATALYVDRPDASLHEPGLAKRVHDELLQGRPVAVALPGFRDGLALMGPTGWDRPNVLLTGQVRDPAEGEIAVPGSGHAVCILGFQASAQEAFGGYFVFRNSWGVEFGRLASDPNRPRTPPFVPMPGYGTLSASHLEANCWEALSLRL